ncbi:MAG TPA: hypothetical protein VHR45_01170 [Thermoanaerobaculia bacterium]|nr:hypothetical protein [Thermoanaerobaculia bacterium]
MNSGMSFEAEFLLALAVTVLIETLVLVGAWRWLGGGAPVRWQRLALAGVLPSAASLPYLWFILPHFVNGPAYAPLGESLVVLGEAPILAVVLDWRPARALLASLLCNGASFLAGPWVLRGLSRLFT